MPSGSHASGGFSGSSHSHSSGGHSSSHFGRSGGSSGSFTPMRGPRVTVFFGRHVYLSPVRAGFADIMSTLLVILIFAGVVLGIFLGATASDCASMEQDYQRYQEMIELYGDNPAYRYTVTGIDVTKVEWDDSGYYRINYIIRQNGLVSYGYSFYVYTFEEARNLDTNGVTLVLDLPVASLTSDSDVDSIPLDFRDKQISDDIEYQEAQQLMGTLWVILAVVVIAGVACVALTLGARATAKTATTEQMATANVNTTTNTNPANTWKCDYCGTRNPDSDNKCNGCGARRK